MSTDIESGQAGALFEDFLKEQGIYEKTTAQAANRIRAFQESGQAGTPFDDFLKEQGIYESTTVQAINRVQAFLLTNAMKE